MKYVCLFFSYALAGFSIHAADESAKQDLEQDTRGNSCLQLSAKQKKTHVDIFDGGQGSAPARANASARVVAITYCDAGFASIWPTFIKCYERALGCSLDARNDGCGPSKTKLLDLGLELLPGQANIHCTRHGPPAVIKPIALDDLSPSHTSDGRNSLQRSRQQQVMALTPNRVPLLIAQSILQQLVNGNDVLRLDADAFLLSDPLKTLQELFPDADVIGSPDCAYAHRIKYCGWYKDRSYRKRHSGKDPLGRTGFMLNTGLMYVRSKPQTISLVQAAVRAIQSGQSTFEQTAFNEELYFRGCRWSLPEKGTRRSPGREPALRLLRTSSMLGRCRGGLNVVVLPYTILTRSLKTAKAGSAVAMHPGGHFSQKIELLPNISALCGKHLDKSGGVPYL
jgi:hypothetical protein